MNKNDKIESVPELEGKFMVNKKYCFFCEKSVDIYFRLTKDNLEFYKNEEKNIIYKIIPRELVLGINRRWRKEKDKNFLSIYYLENRGSNMIKELKLKTETKSDMEKWIKQLNRKIKPKRYEFNIIFKNYVKSNDIFHFEDKSKFYVSLCNLEYILLKNKMKKFFEYGQPNLINNNSSSNNSNNDSEEKDLIYVI